VESGSNICPLCHALFSIDQDECPNDGQVLVPKEALLLPGALLDERFRIQRVLGRGGWGTVYLARQLSTDRDVAVKVLHPWLLGRPHARRFLREARVLSRLSHPNLVTVFDSGATADGTHYIVMEYLRGEPLSDAMRAGEPFPMEVVRDVGVQIAEGLAAVHDAAMVHRDLKPENVFLLAAGGGDRPGRWRVKLLDFGIVKLG